MYERILNHVMMTSKDSRSLSKVLDESIVFVLSCTVICMKIGNFLTATMSFLVVCTRAMIQSAPFSGLSASSMRYPLDSSLPSMSSAKYYARAEYGLEAGRINVRQFR